MSVTLQYTRRHLSGTVSLSSSKSISNRVLMIRALCQEKFPIHRLSDALDTQLMDSLLQSDAEVLDAGAAGTTFRFLSAWLSRQPGTRILTGSERMKQRPVGPLAVALKTLGGNISYLEQEGYPPLRIGPPDLSISVNQLPIPADISSQYISALLMIAPTLPEGLTLTLEGDLVSRPYVDMTLSLMQYFGVSHRWEDQKIYIPAQAYTPRPFTVEADWSAASYYYAMAALADTAEIKLAGLFADSLQGDSVLIGMMRSFGVETHFTDDAAIIHKPAGTAIPAYFEQDFLQCPDLAQTLAVICGALGVPALFSGLETLRIKETDRIMALQHELSKVGVHFYALPPRMAKKSNRKYYVIEGKAEFNGVPAFDTYEDHRMAMAFAPLSLLGEICIHDPEVVVKSYPRFWHDMEALGLRLTWQSPG
jgi:3-phosphoshikimate 1-carboxyvinyltransferase